MKKVFGDRRKFTSSTRFMSSRSCANGKECIRLKIHYRMGTKPNEPIATYSSSLPSIRFFVYFFLGVTFPLKTTDNPVFRIKLRVAKRNLIKLRMKTRYSSFISFEFTKIKLLKPFHLPLRVKLTSFTTSSNL